ncbi:cell wall hydrolase [Rhizobium ruizarguesonis]|uniref:cell wall hydrolase n=1 Tax=Rhizobium ruizarguesonis TaxID=2081791 RepID=UPI0013EEC6FC|nr:cell wall hydrolase [Rhizobium ruizarguesonis]
MTEFQIAASNKEQLSADFHRDPSETSPLVDGNEQLISGTIVEPTGKTGEAGKWIEVDYQFDATAIPLRGWIDAGYLGDPVEVGPASVPPVDIPTFVAECVRYEVTSQDDKTLGADYLVAWAWLESSLTDFTAHFHDRDAVGPFQISSSEWTDYVASGLNITPTPVGRFSGYAQIDCAAWIGKRDVAAFVGAMGTAGIPNYVPSLLNAFHCRLIGVPAAVEVQRIQTAKQSNPPMDEILKQYCPQSLVDILVDRKQYLGKDPSGHFSMVDAFVNTTSAALADAMKKALSLIKANVPEFIPSIDDKKVSAGWMQAAEKEFQFWTANKLDERSPDGVARVTDYFKATNQQYAAGKAWCGAFVAWCLSEAGRAVTTTIVDDPAWAANWKNWGDLELRQRDLTGVPNGAIIVMAPSDGTNGSGHVAFFRQQMPAGKIEILGGNQSDRVKTMVVERNKIVSIRWLSTLDVAPTDKNTAPIPGAGVVGATPRDQIILARTLFGEARGEVDVGIQAVACVVINRLNAAHFGSSVADVCQKRLQFSCWNKSDPNRTIIEKMEPQGDKVFDRCFAIAGDAILGKLNDVTKGATHFFADTVRQRPSWAEGATETAHIGHHIFFKNVP